MAFLAEAIVEGPAGPLNAANVGFSYFGPMSGAEFTATVVSYLSKAMAACSVESLITGVNVRSGTPGSWGPSAPAALPTTELADWHAIDSDSPTPSAWGFVVGAGSTLAAVGTSVNVGEVNVTGGRHNGRHFLPWVGAAALNGSGLVKSTVVTDVQQAADWRLLGSFGSQPTWWSGDFATPTLGGVALAQNIAYIVRSAPARLRSRIR